MPTVVALSILWRDDTMLSAALEKQRRRDRWTWHNGSIGVIASSRRRRRVRSERGMIRGIIPLQSAVSGG